HLVGLVTDGDIRRGLLNKLSLTDPIAMVMNTNPTVANVGARRDELIDLMESKGILSIPLIKEGQVVGLETLQGVLSKPKYQN
ncbi:CBS domain-containing protein, partial [Streptococcus pneumoniae]